jgi:hypothetical protein
MSSGQRVATGILGVLALSTAIAADDLPGLSLQLARQLTPPARAQTVDETERALLRVEWKAAQSRTDEALAVREMLARLDRMGRSIAQLQIQIAATQTVRLPEPRPENPIPVEPAAGVDATIWLPVIGSIAALSLIAVLRIRRRRAPLMEATTFEPLMATQTAVLPGTRTAGPGQTLTPPTIGNDSAIFDDDRPPIELDRPTPAPPGDEQIPLELADILLAMGLADGAAKTLEEYIREHPRQALCHWLKLLDVYRRSNMPAEFEKAAAELRQQFNVAPAEWQAREVDAPAFSLESYPHIRGRLQHLWRRRTCSEYLNQLLEDNRGGTRNGFPQPVVEEILFLLAILRR